VSVTESLLALALALSTTSKSAGGRDVVVTSGKAVFVAASAVHAAIGGGRDVTTSGKAVLIAASAIASIGDESSFCGTFSLSSRGFDVFRLFQMPSCTAASCFFLLLGRGITFSSSLQLATALSLCFEYAFSPSLLRHNFQKSCRMLVLGT
jgi:hypothetical protein